MPQIQLVITSWYHAVVTIISRVLHLVSEDPRIAGSLLYCGQHFNFLQKPS